MKRLNMKSLGRDVIWLTGSRISVWRVVYTDGEKFYCIWYDKPIEVKKESVGYSSVELY